MTGFAATEILPMPGILWDTLDKSAASQRWQR